MTDHVHLLAGAHALDALPLDERAFYERHLTTCDSCCHAVAGYQEAAARLGAAASRPPPAGLRARVLAEVAATHQPAARPHRSLRERLQRPLAAVAGVVVVALVSLGGLSVALWDSPAGSTDAVIAPAFMATAERVRLDGPGDVDAQFVFSLDSDEGYLVVSGLPAAGDDRDYQLWLFHDGVPVPAGVFAVHDGRATVQAEAPVRSAELIAVTAEPAGGLPRPSGPVIMSSPL